MKSFDEYAKLIDDSLTDYIPEVDPHAETINDAMNYSLTAGGKRLRPALLLAATELADGDTDDAMPYAAAIEFIHTYSLIHDDLPAMDDDDMRRGIPTCHKVFGAGMATLAGDALLNSAFEIMLLDISTAKGDAEKTANKVKAAFAIVHGAGTGGMIAGQTADLIASSETGTDELLDYIQHNKTSALIISSVAAGLYIAGADNEMIRPMLNYASLLGRAFQIADDILDVEGNPEEIGKPVGSDVQEDKLTYVSLHGIEEARNHLSELTERACACICDIDKDGFFTDLVRDLEKRKK